MQSFDLDFQKTSSYVSAKQLGDYFQLYAEHFELQPSLSSSQESNILSNMAIEEVRYNVLLQISSN